MIKKIVKIAALLAISTLSPLYLSGTNVVKITPSLGDSSINFDQSSLIRQKKRLALGKNKQVKREYFIAFEAPIFDPDETTGAILVEFPDFETLQTIEYPNTNVDTSLPTATIQFTVPSIFEAAKSSSINFGFLTASALSPVEGSVTFNLVAKILRKNVGGIITKDLGVRIVENVTSSPPVTADAPEINQYKIGIDTSGLFQKGDIVTVLFTRVNLLGGVNYPDSVYQPGAGFIFNKGK